MSKTIPFSLTKRKDRPYYYVRFKNEKTGKYMAWRSTGTANKKEALAISWNWYKNGKEQEPTDNIETMTFENIVRQADIKPDTLNFILAECKRRGVLKNYVLAGSKQDIPAYQFMLDFWTWEKSEYIAEKLNKKHSIHKRHVKKQYGNIKNHWKETLENKVLGELTKADIKRFMIKLGKTDYSFGVKNDIVRACTTALKWAYDNDIIEKDITRGLVFYSGSYKEREILSPEMVQAVFSVQWNDDRCKLANLLAMCTGLRGGEIQGLRLQDLGRDCLYIRHSWNLDDGLKCVKNKENRTVQVPFRQITEALRDLAESNPYGAGMNGYVFYASIADKPMESKTFLYELRQALQKIGMSEEEAKKYTFHGWRHFYIKYMKDKTPEAVLQRQVGHKTLAMLEHYANHKAYNENEILNTAIVDTFGGIVETGADINFNLDKINNYIKTEYKEVQKYG